MPQELKLVFTLRVDLAPPLDFGTTSSGDRRFIPITGGVVEDASSSSSSGKVIGKILAGGGDWNAVRPDGVVHVLAKYAIQMNNDDNGGSTLVNVTNEGYGRASQATMATVFGDDPASASLVDGGRDWYTKTWPRFEVATGSRHEWLNKSCFVGSLLPPQKPNHVVIEIYELL